MIYKHKKTGQKLQIDKDHGDVVTAFILDDNYNKIRIKSRSGNYKTVVCQKNNLIEILK